MIRIGIIGYGYWGPNLVRNFLELQDATVDVVADLNHRQLDAVSRRYPSVRTTEYFQDIIADPAIDAVAIATPVSTHFESGYRGFESGKALMAREADD